MNKEKVEAVAAQCGLTFRYDEDAEVFVSNTISKEQLYELVEAVVLECVNAVDAQYLMMQTFGVQR